MSHEKSYVENLKSRIARYILEVSNIEALIQSFGPNNHLLSLEEYFTSKVESLRERLAQIDSGRKS